MIALCRASGIAAPRLGEVTGTVVVTLRVRVAVTGKATPQVTPPVAPPVTAIPEAARSPQTRAELQVASGLRDKKHFLRAYLEPLLAAGWLDPSFA